MLRDQFPAGTVGLFGDRVHLVTTDAPRDTAKAETALASAGIAIQELRPIEPSLEDVFISVSGTREEA